MKKMTRILSFVLALSVIVTMALTGCGSKDKDDTKKADSTQAQVAPTEDPNKIDTSEKITLNGYLAGDPPAGEQEVLDALNVKLLNDINATLNPTFIGWGDFFTKYPLVLASGEPIDFVLSANWTGYNSEAAKGAFKEITMDMVQKYMPKVYKAVPQDGWKDCLVNNKIYMVPQSFKEQLTYGFLIRGDLRKKYGLPELTKVTDLEKYFELVKQNEPKIIPYNIGKSEENFLNAFTTEDCGYGLYSTTNTLFFNIDDDTNTPSSPFDEPMLSSIKKGAGWIKGLYDKGYLPKNPFVNEVTSGDSILSEGTACAFTNSDDGGSRIATAKAKGLELEFFPVLTPKGNTTVRPQNGNGIAIPTTSQHPERSMMAWDLIMQDEAYNNLVSFGIEGKNYIVKDNKIALPDGVTADKNTYPLFQGGFFMTNRDQWKPLDTQDPYYLNYKEQLKKISKPYPLINFNPVTESIKTEVANLENVRKQYFSPLTFGMVKDVDAALNTWKEKALAAGQEKVVTELKSQAKNFIDTIK